MCAADGTIIAKDLNSSDVTGVFYIGNLPFGLYYIDEETPDVYFAFWVDAEGVKEFRGGPDSSAGEPTRELRKTGNGTPFPETAAGNGSGSGQSASSETSGGGSSGGGSGTSVGGNTGGGGGNTGGGGITTPENTENPDDNEETPSTGGDNEETGDATTTGDTTITNTVDAGNGWMASVYNPPANEEYHIDDVIQIVLTKGDKTINMNQYGWAFSVESIEGNVVFNNNNNGIQVRTAGKVQISVKLTQAISGLIDADDLSNMQPVVFTFNVVNEDEGEEGNHVALHKATTEGGKKKYHIEPYFDGKYITPENYEVSVTSAEGEVDADSVTIGNQEFVFTEGYYGRNMIPVEFSKNGTYIITLTGKEYSPWEGHTLTRTIVISDLE